MNTSPLNCRSGLLFALSAVVLVSFSSVTGLAQGNVYLPPHIRWESDYDAAVSRAEREQRPLFLHFIGNACQPAQQMAVEVFTQPNIIAHLNASFVMVRINASENALLAQKFAVTSIPTDLIMKPNGQIVHRRTGGITAERFADYLTFLQSTLQSEGNQGNQMQGNQIAVAPSVAHSALPPGSFPAVQVPVGSPHPQQAPPSPIRVHEPVPPQRAVGVAPVAADPFPQRPQAVHYSPTGQPPAATAAPIAAPPPLNNNPLRTAEPMGSSLTAPATPPHQVPPAQVQIAHAPPSQVQAQAPTPSAVPAAPSIAATVAEEPALSKMTVEVPLALEGFCPVTLCTEERWVAGNPVFCTMYQGHIFRFASGETLAMFARNPANYIPMAMGEDIVLMVDRNKRVNGNRKFGAWFQGRVFLFASQETLNVFAERPDFYAEIALKYELARKDSAVPVIY